MARRVVTTPDGLRWTVRRRWVPRLGAETVWGRFHQRFRRVIGRMTRAGDVADPGCLEVFGEGLAAGIAIIVIVVLLFFVVVPLLVAVVDILIVLLLAAPRRAGPGVAPPAVARGGASAERHGGGVAGRGLAGQRRGRDRVADVLRATGAGPPGGQTVTEGE